MNVWVSTYMLTNTTPSTPPWLHYEFPSSAEEGLPRHQKENGAATFDGADGVVLVKRMQDFLTNTTPSARLRWLRGILTSRSHPSSAEEGSRLVPKR